MSRSKMMIPVLVGREPGTRRTARIVAALSVIYRTATKYRISRSKIIIPPFP